MPGRTGTSPAGRGTSGRCARTSTPSGAGGSVRECWSTWLRCRPRRRRWAGRLEPHHRRPGCLPAAGARGRRAGDGPGGGGRGDDHVPLDARDRAPIRGRGGGARRISLVPALLLPRPRDHRCAACRGGGVGVRGDRAHRRRTDAGAAASATCEAPPVPPELVPEPGVRRAGSACVGRRGAGARRSHPHLGRPRGAHRDVPACPCWSRGC